MVTFFFLIRVSSIDIFKCRCVVLFFFSSILGNIRFPYPFFTLLFISDRFHRSLFYRYWWRAQRGPGFLLLFQVSVCHSLLVTPFLRPLSITAARTYFSFHPFLPFVPSAAICFTYFRLFHLSCFRVFARHSCCLLFPPSTTSNPSKPSTWKPSNSFLCRPSFSSPLVGLAAGMRAPPASTPPRRAPPRPAPPRHVCLSLSCPRGTSPRRGDTLNTQLQIPQQTSPPPSPPPPPLPHRRESWTSLTATPYELWVCKVRLIRLPQVTFAIS